MDARRCVLIVEDDPDIRQIEVFVVEEMGLAAHAAANGAEALELLRSIEPPCLVLLDIMMPQVDGAAFLEALRNIAGRDLQVVVITALADAPSAFDRRLVVETIKKPFGLEQLEGAIRRWCGT